MKCKDCGSEYDGEICPCPKVTLTEYISKFKSAEPFGPPIDTQLPVNPKYNDV